MRNTMIDTARPSRRRFLQGSAALGAGLVLGFHWSTGMAAKATAGTARPANAFVRIAPDNTVTVIAKHLEKGQGIYTGLATIVAEELDADWEQVRVESAPANAALYNNLHWGPYQGTGGSTGIANSWTQLREAGAKARAMLVAAAAARWGVPAGEITVAKSVVSHGGSGRTANFGELAEDAAKQAEPTEVRLKDPSEFTLIGTRIHRVDHISKTNGTAMFTQDIKLPGMLTAVLARPPRFGATVTSFDATEALKVKGVTDVVQVSRGVAVVARDYWSATQGREALIVEWDDSDAETRSSAEIMESYKAMVGEPGVSARKDGDAEAAFKSAAKTIETAFEFPFLAHAPMEPVNAVARLNDDGVEVWTGSQLQTLDQALAAATAGVKPEQATIHTLMAGGSFGRRATPDSDMVVEAVSVAKAIGGRAPVKVVWSREDDIRGGRYRPMYYHTVKAALDESGKPIAWAHKIIGQSIVSGTPFEGLIQDGIDATSVEGANNLPYAIPNLSVDLVTTELKVPVLWWRAVGSTHTGFSTEVVIDELAELAGADPVEFRRALLKDHPRHLETLNLVAEKAGWGTPLPEGRYRGLSLHESFNSVVGQVAEITYSEEAGLKVERVVCAVDCGIAINPDVITAQMEGGLGYGLGHALHSEITLTNGEVDQSNFHDYESLRIEEMPVVEVHIVPSGNAPTGVGEPGTPPIAAAVANALFQATGKRVRSLPLLKGLSA